MPERRILHIHASSDGVDAVQLRAGEDLVLQIPVRHGVALADGVLIDDHLDGAARDQVERDALAALAAWHRRCDDALRRGPVSVGDLWHCELFCEVFLPVLRVVAGVCAAVGHLQPTELVTHGLDPELATCLGGVLAPLPLQPEEAGHLQRYPTADAAPPSQQTRTPATRRMLRRALEIIGVPSLVRGQILVISYGPTLPVLERLTGAGPAPVIYPPVPPPPALALRAARRGGWIGLPGARGRRAARRWLTAVLDELRSSPVPSLIGPGVDELIHVRALRCLGDRAVPSVALLDLLARRIGRESLDGVIVPFDHEPLAKAVVRIAQTRGIPVLALQHGYEPRKHFHPGDCSDALGAWSRWDLEALAAEERPRTRVIGNPARGTPSAPGMRPTHGARAVVLVEHDSRLTSLIDRRILAQHLELALAGLRDSGQTWRVTVRPHPVDDVEELRILASELGWPGIEVDAETPILDLLAEADVCVGAISTAALQCALVGTPLVMLRPPGLDCLPPLDGSGTVPLATSAAEVAAEVRRVAVGTEIPGREELLEALGHGPPDPSRAALAWLAQLGKSKVS